MRHQTKCTRQNTKRQEGAILFIVILLILMFTGLGLLAMRHTRHELKSTGAYMDATQSAALVEGALAMVATDLRQSSDYYQWEYSSTDSEEASLSFYGAEYAIPLNPDLFTDVITDSICDNATIPDGCVKELSSPVTDNEGTYGTRVLTHLVHNQPVVGPCPPGYSCFDEQNYGWYIFTVNALSTYGPQGEASDSAEEAQALADGFTSTDLFGRGRAQGRGRMTVGPIAAYGK